MTFPVCGFMMVDQRQRSASEIDARASTVGPDVALDKRRSRGVALARSAIRLHRFRHLRASVQRHPLRIRQAFGPSSRRTSPTIDSSKRRTALRTK